MIRIWQHHIISFTINNLKSLARWLQKPKYEKTLFMKTKFILAGILALVVLSTSTFAQTGKVGKTKRGTKKAATTTLKGSSVGTTATTPADTGKAIGTAKPVGTVNTGSRDAGIAKPADVTLSNTPVVAAGDPFKDIIANSAPVIQNAANGSINFTDQYVEAKGSSVIDNDRFKNPAQARLMAERGAIVVAQRNLLETVKGVSIIGETTVEDMITTGDYVYSRVEGVVKGAKQFGPAREENGAITVTLRMPLYDNTNGVTAGFTPNGLQNARISANAADAYVDLVQAGAGVIDGSKPIAFNVAGKKIDPSMFPVVFDENGKVLLDFSKIYEQTGNVPKILQAGKDLFNAAGFSKGADIIDLVEGKAKGTFTLADPAKKSKVNWGKIANVAGKVGKVLLNILL